MWNFFYYPYSRFFIIFAENIFNLLIYNRKMKFTSIIALLLLSANGAAAQNKVTKSYEVTVNNALKRDYKDMPVTIKINDFKADFRVRSAVVKLNGEEIPSQLDDFDGDGHNDELALVLDMKGKSSAKLDVTLCNLPSEKKYKSRVYGDMILNDKNKRIPTITTLSAPGTKITRPYYDAVFLHGPVFESELVGYRIYFDNRQSLDLYGKIKQRIELPTTRFHTTDAQLAEGYGADVLWAGKTVSLGSFRGWDADKKEPLYVDSVKTRQESLRAAGPVRTIIEVKDYDWLYDNHFLTMTQYYTLWAGHRDVKVEVHFEDKLTNETFCTGVQKLETDISGFLDGKKGIAGSWGTNQPEKGKKIFETVGLGIYVPTYYIKDSREDGGNYLFNIGNDGDNEIHYYITFCNQKEENGWKTNKEWFSHVKEWAQQKREEERNTTNYTINIK